MIYCIIVQLNFYMRCIFCYMFCIYFKRYCMKRKHDLHINFEMKYPKQSSMLHIVQTISKWLLCISWQCSFLEYIYPVFHVSSTFITIHISLLLVMLMQPLPSCWHIISPCLYKHIISFQLLSQTGECLLLNGAMIYTIMLWCMQIPE